MSTYCQSCGGKIGEDCFNPQECKEITDHMQQAEQRNQIMCKCQCHDEGEPYCGECFNSDHKGVR